MLRFAITCNVLRTASIARNDVKGATHGAEVKLNTGCSYSVFPEAKLLRSKGRTTKLHPLSPWVYFRRNLGKTLPVSFVVVVAVALVASVVTLIDSIDTTVLTMYGYQRFLTVVTPRNALDVADDLVATIRKEPLTTQMYVGQPAFTVVKTIFGKMPFVVFGLDSKGRNAVISRCGLRLRSGRLPVDGQPEIVLHEDIARNRGLTLGDVVLKPDSEDSYSIVPMRLVGTLEGPVWFAMTSQEFIENHFPLSPHGQIVLTKSPEDQSRLDAILDKKLDKSRSRLWTYASLVRETRDALGSLYLIMTIVISIVVFAISFLTGMLANIYFTQRLPEFATLAAIGYQRNSLLFRVFGEIAILCAIGWGLGALLNLGVLYAIKTQIMNPRGLLLDPLDYAAYRYTLPLPITITVFAITAIGNRLRSLDPVSIIERRQ